MKHKIIINDIETPMYAQVFDEKQSRILFFINIKDGAVILNADKTLLSQSFSEFNPDAFLKAFYNMLIEKGFNIPAIHKEISGVVVVFEILSLDNDSVYLGTTSNEFIFDKDEQSSVAKFTISHFNKKA